MSEALSEFLTLPKGAVITCPNPSCNDRIARLKEDLKPGKRLSTDMFDESGQGLRVDKKFQCKVCNFHWFVLFEDLARIHTARGWFPDEQGIKELINVMH